MNFRDQITFRNYDRDRLIMDSIASKLTSEENALRNRIINAIVDTHQPYSPSEGEREMVETLQKKNALAIAEDGKVYSIYPVSAKETQHRVTLADGRTTYVMCAIDALGCTYTFHQDIAIDSVCSNSGVPIHIEVKNGAIASASSDEIRILHADLKASDNWASCCCCQMLYFNSQADYDAYAKEHNVCSCCSFCLDLEEGLNVGRMLFSDDE